MKAASLPVSVSASRRQRLEAREFLVHARYRLQQKSSAGFQGEDHDQPRRLARSYRQRFDGALPFRVDFVMVHGQAQPAPVRVGDGQHQPLCRVVKSYGANRGRPEDQRAQGLPVDVQVGPEPACERLAQ